VFEWKPGFGERCRRRSALHRQSPLGNQYKMGTATPSNYTIFNIYSACHCYISKLSSTSTSRALACCLIWQGNMLLAAPCLAAVVPSDPSQAALDPAAAAIGADGTGTGPEQLLMQRIDGARAAGSGTLSILLFGDSTCALQGVALNRLLHTVGTVDKEVDLRRRSNTNTLYLQTLPSWNTSAFAGACDSVSIRSQSGWVGETKLVITPIFRKQCLLDMAMYGDILRAALAPPYDIPEPNLVLLGTAGLHHLARLDDRGIEALSWPLVHYEDRLRFSMTGLQEASSPEAELKLFSTHTICDSKIFVPAVRARALACARADPDGCVGAGDPAIETEWALVTDVDDFNASLFSEWGSDNLAQRERAVLAERAFSSRWALVDGHAITNDRCADTKDGDHYSAAVSDELAELLKAKDSIGTMRAQVPQRWRDEAMCGEYPAIDRAKWLVENKGKGRKTLAEAKLQVMREFPAVFSGAGEEAGWGSKETNKTVP